MTAVLAVALLIAGIAAWGILQTGRKRVRAHGLVILAWRWLTGASWHGKPVTDAGWIRPGRKALTATGHASRFHHLPRWKRAAWRTGFTLTPLAALALYIARPTAAARAFLVLAAAASLAAAAWAWLAVRRRKHHRTWLKPLHLALAPIVGVPLPNAPGSWLQVERDRSKAVLELPPGFHGDSKEMERIARGVTARLGLEAPEVKWSLAGPSPKVTFLACAPPPARVELAEIRDAIEAARGDDLVLGIGKRGGIVSGSLSGDSPHIGLSMPSGAGKSVTARCIASQVLYRGGLVLVLDIKRISHTWARGLPNVAYARTAEQIHEALIWLQGEIDRRNQVADAAADVEGEIHANVGPRILVVAEELNSTQGRLKAYWGNLREKDDPKRSPAADALADALFIGRQVRVNTLMIGQRLSAQASGSGDVRENLGLRIFARHSASTWKMLAPEHTVPPGSNHPGRLQVVTSSGVRETQGAIISGAQARELAMAGTVAIPPRSMPFVTRETALAVNGNPGHDLRMKHVSPPIETGPGDGVSLREAQALGILSGSLAGVRTARHRDRGHFPEPVAHDGLTALYDPEALGLWEERRRT